MPMHDDDTPEDDFDAAWERMDEAADAAESDDETDEAGIEITDAATLEALAPPVRVTIVLRAGKVPVAPWAQGWRIGAVGPVEGHVTMLFEHDIDASPVAQLAAITGLLSTIKSAQLDIVWWAIQSRGPFPDEQGDQRSLDEQLSDFLSASDEERGAGSGEDDEA